MRPIVGISWIVCLLLQTATNARADDRAVAVAVIDRAIRAHGGEGRLAQVHVVTRSVRGKMFLFGKEIPFNGEQVVQLPDRSRMTIELGAEGQKSLLTLVVNHDRGWQVTGGATADVGKEKLGELLEEIYVVGLTTLVPLKENHYELAPLPEIKVNSKTAAGIKVSTKGHPESRLYFDKDTGRLVHIERKVREAGVTVDKEYVFSAFREMEGVLAATRQVEVVNGTKVAEFSVTQCKFPGKVEDSVFGKP